MPTLTQTPLAGAAAMYAALDRIVARTMIADCIHYGDFPKAERLIVDYVDRQLALIRTH